MSMTMEQEHFVQTKGDDLELIQDLGRRLGCLWECERYIASAEGRPELQEYWRGAKSQEQENIDQLKSLITQHTPSNGL